MPSFAAVIPTDEGVFLVRDVAADTPEAQRPAARAARIPGHRGGRAFVAAGAVLRVICAHQYSRPHLTIEVLDREPDDEPGWEWVLTTTLELPTGRVQADCGEEPTPPDLLDIGAGAGPGHYGLTLGHRGRDAMLARATRGETDTPYTDATSDAERLERYLVRIWPR